jgi:hypothetical protein
MICARAGPRDAPMKHLCYRLGIGHCRICFSSLEARKSSTTEGKIEPYSRFQTRSFNTSELLRYFWAQTDGLVNGTWAQGAKVSPEDPSLRGV